MKPGYRRATLLVCSALVAGAIASPASARPDHRHHARHRAVPTQTIPSQGNDGIYAVMRADYAHKKRARAHGRRHRVIARSRRGRAAFAKAPLTGGFSSNDLVADARRYIGTNPTGRRSLWCGAFMDKILRDTGHKGGGNLALGYLHYGRRVSGPRVGAIAVMRRRGGGHVGVVAGIDPNGNPIIISGNHNHTTAEAIYPRHRIIAYVMPNN
jgi:uncharacterized protein (TIGR02594 family)